MSSTPVTRQLLGPTLVVGASGYLGRHFLAEFREADASTVGTSRRPTGNGLVPLDLMAPDVGGLPLSGCRQAVIAAAITKVDACEADPEGTRRVNVLGTLALVRQLWDRDILPVFLSSDYVFPGTDPSGYGDSAQPCPATEYGRQKAEVEAALGTSGRPHLVLRLS